MGYRDGEPFLAFGGKIDPLSEIRNAGIITSGSVFWVKATTDADYTTFQFQVGANIVLNDFQTALTKCRNDRNDYVMVVPQDTNTVWTNTSNVGSAVILNKARTHLLSIGYGKGLYGYSNTLRGFGTSAAYDTAIVKVNAPGCEIAGFRILGTAGTTANGSMTAIVTLGTASTGTAHNTWIHDCALEANNASGGGAGGTPTIVTMTNATGPDGARFDNCVIGNSLGPCISVAVNNIGKRHTFNRCILLDNAQATADNMVTAGTGLTEFLLFKECEFINLNSAQLPASAVTGSTTTTNPVLLNYCTYQNITKAGTDPTVYVSPTQSGTAQAGIHNLGIAITGTSLLPAA